MNNIGDTNIELSLTPEMVDVLWELATAEIESIDDDLERGALSPEERAAALQRYGALCQITARLWTGTAFWAIDNEDEPAVQVCEECEERPGIKKSSHIVDDYFQGVWICAGCELEAKRQSVEYGRFLSGGAS